MRRRFAGLVSIAWIGAALHGCALLSKSEPLAPRYYTPELRADDAGAGREQPATSPADHVYRPLRIGRIEATSQLRERIVYRTSTEESGYYANARWTERPENYLRRALSRSLFEKRQLTRAVSGSAPMLEAELLAFEEVRGSPNTVRLQIVVTLHDDRVTRFEQTITIEHAVPTVPSKAHTAAVVRALGAALHEAVERIADKVIVALSTPAP